LPRAFWFFVVGVSLFGLGDFSRTFLIFLTARALGEQGGGDHWSLALLIYCGHNAVSAVAAYPAGRAGDQLSARMVLVGGYLLGAATNALLAINHAHIGPLLAAVVLSGIYIAVEEALEKATAARFLPRELRSLGLGVLACANAIGDMGSSLFVGWMLESGQDELAFAVPAGLGLAGAIWMLAAVRFPATQRPG
jgi:MFS family permease